MSLGTKHIQSLKSQLINRLALQLAIVQLDKFCRFPRPEADKGDAVPPVDTLDLFLRIFLDDAEHFSIGIEPHQPRARGLTVHNAALLPQAEPHQRRIGQVNREFSYSVEENPIRIEDSLRMRSDLLFAKDRLVRILPTVSWLDRALVDESIAVIQPQELRCDGLLRGELGSYQSGF